MAKGSYRKMQLERGVGYPLGAYVMDDNRVQFSVSLTDEIDCRLHILLQKPNRKMKHVKPDYQIIDEPYFDESALYGCQEIVVPVIDRFLKGNIFTVIVPLEEYENCYYYYEQSGRHVKDPYAYQLIGREVWGVQSDDKQYLYRIHKNSQNTSTDNRPYLSFQDVILYRMHVRGFTKDSSSGVKAKGTFRGAIEKIPYLKELGITAVELMPCYEFNEIVREDYARHYPMSSSITKPVIESGEWKLNYWGYTEENYYFAPKASFCQCPEHACEEFREMVEAFHENGMEVYMEFHFGFNTNQSLILDCLHYWQNQYQVDGFRLNQEWIPEKLLATDPMLCQVKLFSSEWNIGNCYPDGRVPRRKHLGDDNSRFQNCARRFLKGDEEQVQEFANVMRSNPEGKVSVNYLANTNGFTLMDMVSYDVKHNEDNQEQGLDGTNYNYSWNCGAEGKTRKKAVLELRKKQLKNALAMLFFSQGVPLILAGDEFGNSQNGNNNPYCLDNETTWVNWNELKKNEWLYEYVKRCIQIRKSHKILHMEEALRGTDFISCGNPDISFHGLVTWYPDYTNYSRVLGIMLCGKYVKLSRTEYDKDFYLAFNFHWEDHEFHLPKPPKGKKWSVLLNTHKDHELELIEGYETVEEKSYMIPARTAVIFIEE